MTVLPLHTGNASYAKLPQFYDEQSACKHTIGYRSETAGLRSDNVTTPCPGWLAACQRLNLKDSDLREQGLAMRTFGCREVSAATQRTLEGAATSHSPQVPIVR